MEVCLGGELFSARIFFDIFLLLLIRAQGQFSIIYIFFYIKICKMNNDYIIVRQLAANLKKRRQLSLVFWMQRNAIGLLNLKKKTRPTFFQVFSDFTIFVDIFSSARCTPTDKYNKKYWKMKKILVFQISAWYRMTLAFSEVVSSWGGIAGNPCTELHDTYIKTLIKD